MRGHAPDLLTVVSSLHLDRSSGATTCRLKGFRRGDPDASLFKVPEEQKLRSGPQREERKAR